MVEMYFERVEICVVWIFLFFFFQKVKRRYRIFIRSLIRQREGRGGKSLDDENRGWEFEERKPFRSLIN